MFFCGWKTGYLWLLSGCLRNSGIDPRMWRRIKQCERILTQQFVLESPSWGSQDDSFGTFQSRFGESTGPPRGPPVCKPTIETQRSWCVWGEVKSGWMGSLIKYLAILSNWCRGDVKRLSHQDQCVCQPKDVGHVHWNCSSGGPSLSNSAYPGSTVRNLDIDLVRCRVHGQGRQERGSFWATSLVDVKWILGRLQQLERVSFDSYSLSLVQQLRRVRFCGAQANSLVRHQRGLTREQRVHACVKSTITELNRDPPSAVVVMWSGWARAGKPCSVTAQRGFLSSSLKPFFRQTWTQPILDGGQRRDFLTRLEWKCLFAFPTQLDSRHLVIPFNPKGSLLSSTRHKLDSPESEITRLFFFRIPLHPYKICSSIEVAPKKLILTLSWQINELSNLRIFELTRQSKINQNSLMTEVTKRDALTMQSRAQMCSTAQCSVVDQEWRRG